MLGGLSLVHLHLSPVPGLSRMRRRPPQEDTHARKARLSPAHSNSPAVPSWRNKQPRGQERSRGSHLGTQGHPQGSGASASSPGPSRHGESRWGQEEAPPTLRDAAEPGEAASAQGTGPAAV